MNDQIFSSNVLADTKRWFDIAVPAPTDKNRAVQLGCHYEEISEMFEAMGDEDERARMHALAEFYKKHHPGFGRGAITNHKGMLDAICDQIVTAVGVAHMMGYDVLGALAEVNRSNYSKFVNGEPMFNEHGKIAKPDTFSEADVTPFLGN